MDHARVVHARIWAERGGEEVRYYQCGYSAWHWTRTLEPQHQRKQAA